MLLMLTLLKGLIIITVSFSMVLLKLTMIAIAAKYWATDAIFDDVRAMSSI